jgi:hypothetical protein
MSERLQDIKDPQILYRPATIESGPQQADGLPTELESSKKRVTICVAIVSYVIALSARGLSSVTSTCKLVVSAGAPQPRPSNYSPRSTTNATRTTHPNEPGFSRSLSPHPAHL